MRDFLKVGLIALLAAFVGGVLAVTVVGGNDQSPSAPVAVGGYTEGYWDSAEGYRVDGTTVIDGSGNWDGVITSGTSTTGSFTKGGAACTLTDANGGTYTLTDAEMANCGSFTFAAGGAGQAVIALAMPATSTMEQTIPTAGQCRTWLYDASALAVATTTTLTLGTGHNIIAYTTNDDVIDGAEFAQIQMCRRSDTDVNTIVTELLHAD